MDSISFTEISCTEIEGFDMVEHSGGIRGLEVSVLRIVCRRST